MLIFNNRYSTIRINFLFPHISNILKPISSKFTHKYQFWITIIAAQREFLKIIRKLLLQNQKAHHLYRILCATEN
jgi:hypothetical protein